MQTRASSGKPEKGKVRAESQKVVQKDPYVTKEKAVLEMRRVELREQRKEKAELVERYLATFRPIENALHLALLEIGDAVNTEKHFLGTVWRLIAVNLEKTATFVDIDLATQSTFILESVPNGRLKLSPMLDSDELSVKARRIPDFTLYGLPGILRLVDAYRLSQIFRLCRRLLITSSNFTMYHGEGKEATGVVNVITSIFGDAALHREVNPHPSALHIYRVFIASATNAAFIEDRKAHAHLIDGLVTAVSREIESMKLAGSSAEKCDSMFGISVSTQMSTSFDSSTPFLYLDRFITYEKIKTFVNRILFSIDARSSDEAELVLNCYVINDFENTEKGITDLPHIFPAYIHYSWALVKPSSSNDLLSTVLHGGQPPLSLVFTSAFDDLSALQSYLRLFDSPQSVNSISNPNDVFTLRRYYQEKLSYFAVNRSFDNLFDLSLSILAYGSTIGPPIFGQEIDSDSQKQLIESVTKLFTSNASALRALVNYGLALGLCGSRFVGTNEVRTKGNGRWYAMACQNFTERIRGFFGVDKIHYRTIPTADSSPLANLLLTTAAAILPDEESENLPVCMTALPNIIAGIAMYAQVYWSAVATASTLTNCHYLLSTISNLRSYKSSNNITDTLMSEITLPLSLRQVVSQFLNCPPEKGKKLLGHETASSYLRAIMRTGKFHVDYCEMTLEMLVTTLISTPKSLGESPDTRRQSPNDSWLANGARLAKFASVRGFSLSSSSTKRIKSSGKHIRQTLGAHPALLHHLSHCNGCPEFASRILTVMSFLNPRSNYPQCFRPVLALSGPSGLRCSYQGPDSSLLMTPILLTQFWLPGSLDAELVAAPLDSIAEAMSNYLSALCIHGTAVQLLSFRFVVLNSLTTFDEEDLSCYEIPPVDVALPVAFRDISGCAMELHRWWSVSPRHRVLLRGVIDISEPPTPGLFSFSNKTPDYDPCFVEFLVDIRPCFTSEFATGFRPFDRLSHIFATTEEYNHYQACFIRLAGANDATTIGLGVGDLDNTISMASFFSYPLLPFAQRQLDIDIHSRYASAMASSNWYEATLLANWHAILIPVLGEEQWNCILADAEAVFRNSMMFTPLLQLPSWLKGLSSLALYCRDSLLMALNFSSGTSVEIGAEALIGPLSSFQRHKLRNEALANSPVDLNFCQFELGLMKILATRVKTASFMAASTKNSAPDTLFANESTGYSSIAWAVASGYIHHALHCILPEEFPSPDRKLRWQNLIDRFCAAGHDLSKLAALALGYCDTISYYNLFAFSKKHQMIKRVSFSCLDDPSSDQLPCPAPPRGIFRQDVVALTRTPVYE